MLQILEWHWMFRFGWTKFFLFLGKLLFLFGRRLQYFPHIKLLILIKPFNIKLTMANINHMLFNTVLTSKLSITVYTTQFLVSFIFEIANKTLIINTLILERWKIMLHFHMMCSTNIGTEYAGLWFLCA